MSIFHRSSNWLRQLFIRVLASLLIAVMTAHGKRMMFVTSLYVKMKGIIPTQPESLLPLVNDLHLAPTPSSLMFPANFTVNNWDTETIKQLQNAAHDGNAALKAVCMAIVNATPRFLQYKRKDDMVEDMMGVIAVTQRSEA